MATHTAMAQGSDANLRSSLEQKMGIKSFVSPRPYAWHGQLRTRFTDFQVNEIDKDGKVVHLHEVYTNAKDFLRSQSSQSDKSGPTAAGPSKSQPENTGAGKEQEVQNTPVPASASAVGSDQPKEEGATVPKVSSSDEEILVELVGPEAKVQLLDLFEKVTRNPNAKPKSFEGFQFPVITDKAQRSRVHAEVRRIFGGKIDTVADSGGVIKATASSASGGQKDSRDRNQQRSGRNGGDRSRNPRQNQEHRGKFLHFSLYKENRDTMDAINHITRTLRLKPKDLATAGTKDRRAVTVQRVSMKSRDPQSLVFLNNDRVYGVKIGDFKFEQEPLRLGSHNGNEFTIVLKNCCFSGTENMSVEERVAFARDLLEPALAQTAETGFLNYYGTQRFGTHEIGTQEIGQKILKGNFEGAIMDLLSFDASLLNATEEELADPVRRDSINRAKACSIFLDTYSFQSALNVLPKRCNVEYAVMRHLEKQNRDFVGALMAISRGMRSMYVHAYQSLVWNNAVSLRWEKFGNKVIKGDLVMAQDDSRASNGQSSSNQDPEDTIHLGSEEVTDDTGFGFKAHVVTEEEASSGKYSIFDVILPTPGHDVIYPQNEIGDFYTEFMGREENGGLDPHNMYRKQRDFSLPGSYRKIMGKFIGTPSVSVQEYADDTDQLVPTDMDRIRSRQAEQTAELREKSSPWHKFAQNVKENERQEDRAQVERRKAEGTSTESNQRVNDTWIQTTVDGSNKRVKLASHFDSTEGETAPVNSETDNTAADNSSREHGTSGDDVTMKDVAGDEQNQPQGLDGNQLSNRQKDDQSTSIASVVATQVRRTTTKIMRAIETFVAIVKTTWNKMTDLIMTKTQSDKLQQQPKDNDSSSAPVKAEEKEIANTDQPDKGTSEATDKKVAVIVQFGLHTSSYATVALRELQGEASA